MAIVRTALVCCLFALVCAAQWQGQISVQEGRLLLAERGVVDFSNTEDVQELLATLYDLCEYYNTCNSSLHVPEDAMAFLGCCVPCDCSDECYKIGNNYCCRDMVGDTRTVDQSLPDADGQVCTVVKPLDTNDLTDAYMIVYDCSPEYQGDARDECLNGSVESFHNTRVVYSELTGLLYANVHCARCNNQINLSPPWQIKMVCDNVVPVQYEMEYGLIVNNGCDFLPTPTEIMVAVKRCYTKLPLAVCERAKYKKLCRTVSQGYGFVKDLEANVCFGCIQNLLSQCSPGHFTTKSFEALLNMQTVGDVAKSLDRATTDTVCPDGTKFDSFEKKCLRLACSPSQVLIKAKDNHCIDIYSHVRGLCLDYRLLVTIATDDLVSLQVLERSLSGVVEMVIPNDKPINSDIVEFTSANGYVLYQTRVTVKLEQFTDVRERVRELMGMLKYAPYIPDTTVELDTVGHAYLPQLLDEIGYISFEDATGSIDGCTKMVAMNPIQICEMVTFSPEEYSTRGTTVILLDGREFQSYEYVFRPSRDGIQHVQICLETYLYRDTVKCSDSNQIVPAKFAMFVWAVTSLYVLTDISYVNV